SLLRVHAAAAAAAAAAVHEAFVSEWSISSTGEARRGHTTTNTNTTNTNTDRNTGQGKASASAFACTRVCALCTTTYHGRRQAMLRLPPKARRVLRVPLGAHRGRGHHHHRRAPHTPARRHRDHREERVGLRRGHRGLHGHPHRVFLLRRQLRCQWNLDVPGRDRGQQLHPRPQRLQDSGDGLRGVGHPAVGGGVVDVLVRGGAPGGASDRPCQCYGF
ncbi:unnamed protein product, partial [Laminaria digitata]